MKSSARTHQSIAMQVLHSTRVHNYYYTSSYVFKPKHTYLPLHTTPTFYNAPPSTLTAHILSRTLNDTFLSGFSNSASVTGCACSFNHLTSSPSRRRSPASDVAIMTLASRSSSYDRLV